MICPNDNNGEKLFKFTVSDITNGNGDLTYKIGILTANEMIFAGYDTDSLNRTLYLNENSASVVVWSLSPSSFSYGYANILDVGATKISNDFSNNVYGLRPAISLVFDIKISSGNGTSKDPYAVSNQATLCVFFLVLGLKINYNFTRGYYGR